MKLLLQIFILFQIKFFLGQQVIDSSFSQFLLLKPSSKFGKVVNELSDIKNGISKEQFTILHFGDSHIQGDFFSGEIRSQLQSTFGIAGQGILFPYSLCKSYGPKGVKVTSKGQWTGTNILKNVEKNNIGVAGYTISSSNDEAVLKFDITDKFTGTISNRISIWTSSDTGSIDYELNDGMKLVNESYIAQNMKVRTYESDSLIYSFTLSLKKSTDPGSKFYFHGFEFDFNETPGVNYHHLGVVGAQFTHLIFNAELVQKQIQHLKPNLIIFSFGTNEAYDQKVDTTFYYNSIENFIKNISLNNPNVEFLLTTAPDTRSQGRVPPNQQTVNRQLHRLAEKLDLSLFDLNQAMGGWGSLKNWYANQLTLTDKLHFNVQGYKLQGKMFSFAFLNEYNRLSKNERQVPLSTLAEDINIALKPMFKHELKAAQDTSLINPEPIIKQEVKKKQKTTTYTVKSGDTISEIARKHKVSIQKILVANRMKETSIIRPGQRLIIPKS